MSRVAHDPGLPTKAVDAGRGSDLAAEKIMTSCAFDDLCKAVGVDPLQKGDMVGPPAPGPQRTPPPAAGPGIPAPTPPGAVPAPGLQGAPGGPPVPPPGPPAPPISAAADNAPPAEDEGEVDPEVQKALEGCRFRNRGSEGTDLVGTGEGKRLAKILEQGEEKVETDFSLANGLGGGWK